jgi:hypothetical protein
MTSPLLSRRWLRFSLRAILGAMVVAAILLAGKVNQVSAQRRAVAGIEKNGGSVTRSGAWGPAWLRAYLGEDYFSDVYLVRLWNVDDEVMASVATFPDVQIVVLLSFDVSDEGMSCLADARSISQVRIQSSSKLPYPGIVHLGRLPRLKTFHFSGNAGLQDFAGLTSVTELYLDLPKISGEGSTRCWNSRTSRTR